MNPLIEYNLALILFLPWFLILGALYWIYPRQPRHAARVMFDIAALAGVDVVVNLCGVGVGEKRWSGAFKQSLRDSRIGPTEVLAAHRR